LLCYSLTQQLEYTAFLSVALLVRICHLSRQLKNFITIFQNGLTINFNQSLKQDFFNSFIFCITLAILILGFPDTFDGFVSWTFKAIYPHYSAMDLNHQFHFERLMWAQIKISLFISMPIFLLSLIWSMTFYNADRKILFPNNAIYLLLFTYRWVIAIQFTAMLLTPFLAIKILDINQLTKTGAQINQIPFWIMKKEMVCLVAMLVLFLFNFLYQAKKLLDSIQAVPRKITQKFAFTAIIPIMLGFTTSTFFHNLMETDGSFNEDTFIYNQCIYIKNNPNIPGNNAIKATLQEIGCKKYTACFTITDERLKNNCLVALYTKSKNFNFLVCNENGDICHS